MRLPTMRLKNSVSIRSVASKLAITPSCIGRTIIRLSGARPTKADSIPSPLQPDLKKFVSLLVEKHREQYLKFIFNSYVSLYLKQNNMKLATLTTVVPNPALENKIRDLVRERTGCGLDLTVKTDPSLIGGFKLVVDDLLLDASVSSQLDNLRKQFIDNSSRIV